MSSERAEDQKPRVPLSQDRVLSAAIKFADERGIENLSMRKLADELGFGVMSLYNHVAGKDEMLNSMVDRLADELERTQEAQDWKASLRQSAVSAHEMLMAHPWAVDLWSSGWPGPGRLRHAESLLAALHAGGFSAELIYSGFHALTTHIAGSAMRELSLAFDEDDIDELAKRFFSEVPVEEYPLFTEHAMAHINQPEHSDDFLFALDLILTGLERTRDSG